MICAPAEGRPAFRVGAWDRNGREHSEDGADDHALNKRLANSRVCAERQRTQSRRAKRIKRMEQVVPGYSRRPLR